MRDGLQKKNPHTSKVVMAERSRDKKKNIRVFETDSSERDAEKQRSEMTEWRMKRRSRREG